MCLLIFAITCLTMSRNIEMSFGAENPVFFTCEGVLLLSSSCLTSTVVDVQELLRLLEVQQTLC